MPAAITSPFLFAITNFGSERALKQEAADAGLTWRSSYQKKGFVTFKSAQEGAPFTLAALHAPLGLARRLCISLGKFATEQEAIAALEPHFQGKRRRLLHQVNIAERPTDPQEAVIEMPEQDEQIATVVKLGDAEFWAGLHQHSALRSPYPGGASGLPVHADSPSRAWLKLEEAVRFFGLTLRTYDIVVELGCSPGGVILALVQRGISSIGVDPAKLAPILLPYEVKSLPGLPGKPRPWVYHCQKPAAIVAKRDLATPVTWFMSDMNQSPTVALKECARFIKMCPTIRQALITLKLTDLMQISEKPAWFAALRSMGFRTMRVQQLAVHHHELALLATGRQD